MRPVTTTTTFLTLLAMMLTACGAGAQPAAPGDAERAAYAAFVRAVRDADAAAIRKCFFVERPESAAALDRAVDQLVTFRRFERLAGPDLGRGRPDWRFGTSDAALDARLAAVRTARLAGGALALGAHDLTHGLQCVGLGPTVEMEAVGPGDVRLSLERNLPEPPARFAAGQSLHELFPGPKVLDVFKGAAAELEAGRVVGRAAVKRWVDERLKAVDEAQFAEAMKAAPAARDADTAAARQAVEEYIRAGVAMDGPRMKKVIAFDGPDAAKALDHRIDGGLVMRKLRAAVFAARGEPLDDPRPPRTLANVGQARLVPEGEGRGMLWLFGPRTIEQIADPRLTEGALGYWPELCPVFVSGGTWKVDARQLFRASAADELKSEYDRARDEETAGVKALLAKVDAKEITTFPEIMAEMQEVKRHVDAAVEQRRLLAEENRRKTFAAWAASDAGRLEVAALTAKDTRLHFRIEAAEGDSDAELLVADGRPVLVSRAVALNGRAVARAKATRLPSDDRDVVEVTLTESGGRLIGELTSKNVNRRLAIVFDGKIVTAPTIQGEIGVNVLVSVSSRAEAEKIVKALNPTEPPKP